MCHPGEQHHSNHIGSSTSLVKWFTVDGKSSDRYSLAVNPLLTNHDTEPRTTPIALSRPQVRMRACVFARHPKVRGSLLPHAYCTHIVLQDTPLFNTSWNTTQTLTQTSPLNTSRTAFSRLYTSNSEHIMSNIALGVLLVKVL